MATELADHRVGGQRVGDEFARRAGQDDLAAMAGGRDPRCAVDLEPAVVVAGEMGLAAVEAHPDLHSGVGRPRVVGHRSLGGDRGADRGTRLGEHREQGIALGPDGHPVVGLDRPPEHGQVLGVDGVPARPQGSRERHRPLDIGAQERHRSGRQRRSLGTRLDRWRHALQPTAG